MLAFISFSYLTATAAAAAATAAAATTAAAPFFYLTAPGCGCTMCNTP